MTTTPPSTELDADQIQNIINLTLASAYDTVASWMLPTGESEADLDKRLAQQQKEFEALAFRPPRLGLGAEPPSSAASSRDVHKLRTKLVGKRGRQDEDVKGKGKADPQDEAGDDDDEESKSRSVSSAKRPKLANTGIPLLDAFDPTAGTTAIKKKKKKKKKKKLDAGPEAEEQPPPPPIAGPDPPSPHNDADTDGGDDGEEWGGITVDDSGPDPYDSTSTLQARSTPPPTFTPAAEPHLGRLNPTHGVSTVNSTPTPKSTASPPPVSLLQRLSPVRHKLPKRERGQAP